jgi:hypothetical protein
MINSSSLERSASMLRSPMDDLAMYNSVGSSWLNTGSKEDLFDSSNASAVRVSSKVCFHPSASLAVFVACDEVASARELDDE